MPTKKPTPKPNAPKKRPSPSGSYTHVTPLPPPEPVVDMKPRAIQAPARPAPIAEPDLKPVDDAHLHAFVRHVYDNPGYESPASWALVADRAEREGLVRRRPHTRELTVGKVGQQYLGVFESHADPKKEYMNIQISISAQAKAKRLASELDVNVKDMTSEIIEAVYDSWRVLARFGQTPWEAIRSLASR